MKLDKLVLAAKKAREQAYASYSGFTVGAAILTKSGQVFVGCNVENASLGLTICAERSAVVTAVGDGEKDFEAIAIVANSNKPALPCGACRQVLAEFSPSMEVFVATTAGKQQQFSLSALLPLPKQGLFENPDV